MCEHNIDVCFITETWLTAAVPDSLVCPAGYVAFRRDRTTPGGGVAILVKHLISAEMIDVPAEFDHIEIVCVDLSFSSVTCRIICFYRKPGFCDENIGYMIDCIQCLKKLCSTDKLVVIAGDCNLPDIDWSCYHSPNSPVYNTFIDFVNNYGFHQFVHEPTRNENILDIVMATSDSFLEDLGISPPLGTSDHNTIIFRTNIFIGDACSINSVPYFDFLHADYSTINECLSATDWSRLFSQTITVDDSWCALQGILADLCNRYVPVRNSNVTAAGKKGIHYPQYIKRILKRKAILWKKWKITKSPADKFAYKVAAANCRAAINKYHAARELALIRKNNVGSFYNFVRSRLKTKTIDAALKTPDGSMTRDAGEKADIFNCFLVVFLRRTTGFVQMFQCGSIMIASIQFCLHPIWSEVCYAS